MSAFLSLVRKDLRLLRWPWLGWLAMFIAKLVLGAWFILTTRFDPADNTLAIRLNLTLTALSALGGYLLTLHLVQADSPVRPRAFWRTRPITGAQLLAAKATTAFLLFGLAPVLITLPWWLINGLGGSVLALALAELLVGHALVVGPAFLIGALLDTFSRAVLWSIVQFGALTCLPFFLKIDSDTLVDLEPGLASSRAFSVAAFGVVALPTLIYWQFSRRRSVQTLAALGASHIVVLFIWLQSPFNFASRKSVSADVHPERGRDISLQLGHAGYVYPRHSGPGPRRASVLAKARVTGVPPGHVMDARLVSLTLTPRDGHPLQAKAGHVWTGPKPAPDQLRAAMSLPALPAQSPADATPPFSIYYELPADEARRLQTASVTANALLRARLYQIEILQNQPLAGNPWSVDRHGGRRLIEIQSGDIMRLHCVQTGASPVLNILADVLRTNARDPYAYLDAYRLTPVDLIAHPDYPERTELAGSRQPALTIFGVGLDRSECDLPVPHLRRDGKLVPAADDLDAWHAGLRFVRVGFREAESFSLAARSDDFVVRGSPEPAAKNPPAAAPVTPSAP